MWKQMILGLRQQNLYSNLTVYRISTILMVIAIVLLAGSSARAQSWSGPTSLSVTAGSVSTVNYMLTNDTAAAMSIDTIEMRGTSPQTDVNLFLITLAITPASSPVLTLMTGTQAQVTVTYSPEVIGISNVLLTAIVNGLAFDEPISASALPAPPTNVEVITQ